MHCCHHLKGKNGRGREREREKGGCERETCQEDGAAVSERCEKHMKKQTVYVLQSSEDVMVWHSMSISTHCCNHTSITEKYPTPIRHPSDTHPTPIRHLSDMGLRDPSISKQFEGPLCIRHLSDTYPTPIRHLSDTHPTPIRHPSDNYPTPIRHPSCHHLTQTPDADLTLADTRTKGTSTGKQTGTFVNAAQYPRQADNLLAVTASCTEQD